ncbi:hypothetical protein EBR78_02895 [bacterium]|nr:hypothetical protein [bacterium]NBX82145.1 hypothetical protein [bacterium]
MLQFLLIGFVFLGGAASSLAAPRSHQPASHSEVDRSPKKRPLENTSFVQVLSPEEQQEIVQALNMLFEEIGEINHGRRAIQPTN